MVSIDTKVKKINWVRKTFLTVW